MAELLFGTAGVPHSARERSTVSGIERSHELGLGGMEMEFVRGVNMTEDTAREVAQAAVATGIRLSAHAPYYINLNSREAGKIKASQERLLKTARIAGLCGGRSVIFHAAFYMGGPAQQAYDNVKQYLAEVVAQLREEDNQVTLRPEVMGKVSQFGTIEETLRLCQELAGIAPCIDFAHWHARTGKANSYDEFVAVLKEVQDYLGRAALDDIHIHLSGINYGAKGERNHLNLRDSDMNYLELLQALRDEGVGGLVICESPNLEEDAQLLQQTYLDLLAKG